MQAHQPTVWRLAEEPGHHQCHDGEHHHPIEHRSRDDLHHAKAGFGGGG
ncbi:MAG: hypothetical protein R3B90_14045 [Planctomycetaceae bacterium]